MWLGRVGVLGLGGGFGVARAWLVQGLGLAYHLESAVPARLLESEVGLRSILSQIFLDLKRRVSKK